MDGERGGSSRKEWGHGDFSNVRRVQAGGGSGVVSCDSQMWVFGALWMFLLRLLSSVGMQAWLCPGPPGL